MRGEKLCGREGPSEKSKGNWSVFTDVEQVVVATVEEVNKVVSKVGSEDELRESNRSEIKLEVKHRL